MSYSSISISQGSRAPTSRGYSSYSLKTDVVPQSRRAYSVYGSAGNTRISTPSVSSAIGSNYSSTLSSALPNSSYGGNSYNSYGGNNYSSSSFTSAGPDYLLNTSRKETMQNLNDRLASYLENVSKLETRNKELDAKIKDWYEKRGAGTKGKDFSHFHKTITELQKQINAGNVENAKVAVKVDNAKLAADDFRLKLEGEQAVKMSVEGDIHGLRKILDEMTLARSDLEMQNEGLREEMAFLKKTHEDEIKALRSQLGGQVNVEVDAAPSEDINKKLELLRQQYAHIEEQNRKEAEEWFRKKCGDLDKNMASSTEALQTTKTEINELRRTVQGLEIELQSQLSMRSALEGQLAETEHRYSSTLLNLQNIIHQKEEELSNIRNDIERQSAEYKVLLDVKSKLESEIKTYRRLLDGDDEKSYSPSYPSTVKKETVTITSPTVTRNVKTVVEEIVNGKVVSKKEYSGSPHELDFQ